MGETLEPTELKRGQSHPIEITPNGEFAIGDLVYSDVLEGEISPGRIKGIKWVFPEYGQGPEVQILKVASSYDKSTYLSYDSIGLKKVDQCFLKPEILEETKKQVNNLPEYKPEDHATAGRPILESYLKSCGIEYTDNMVRRILRRLSPHDYFTDRGLARIDYEYEREKKWQKSFIKDKESL